MENKQLTFWEHVDELRSVIVRIVVCIVLLSVVLFCFKDSLFAIILAPSHSDFLLYRLIDSNKFMSESYFASQLINTELTGQFIAHMQVSLMAAIVIGAPYVLWQLFSYLSPALYDNERRVVRIALMVGSILFYIGVLLSYVLIFPLSFRFLITYQVADEVSNMIQLSSYLDTMMVLCLLMGILFELPLVSVLLGRLGIITAQSMSVYRRHAILAILIVAAVITPTTDVFTLSVVALPIYLLYECSIICVRMVGRK